MKTAALLLAATLMTVGGAWVQAQSTTNVNQTGNHTNNPNDPGQKSDESDKLDNKDKLVRQTPWLDPKIPRHIAARPLASRQARQGAHGQAHAAWQAHGG